MLIGIPIGIALVFAFAALFPGLFAGLLALLGLGCIFGFLGKALQ